ncbi:alanine racemase [Candidatus Izimaplasma bacterium]|nr:alanine racemase [Candidatus Izimaplasma bacterium]
MSQSTMNKTYRKTYAEINLKNLYLNYKSVQNIVGSKKVIPVVKANAYGHGSIEVVKYLRSNGVDHYAVSLLEEAIELREVFSDIKLLVMGVSDGTAIKIAAENNITITISNFSQVKKLKKIEDNVSINLKFDSGMNRLGFKMIEDINTVLNELKSYSNIHIEGIFTHFATADEDKKYYDQQTGQFEKVLNSTDFDFGMIHSSNSSSAIKYEMDIDYTTHVRLGISLYGLSLDTGMDFLKNTYKLISYISEIKYLSPGDKVGYGATYTARTKEIIGILPLGYADGFIRKNSPGDVEINGKRYPIVGRICMDQLFIKIDDTISREDKVTLFGGLITIDEVAKRLDTINHEVICQITNRVPKIYIK